MTISEEFIQNLENKTTVEKQKLANDFFITFSRFEYALKKSGFFTKAIKTGNISADWDSFINENKDVFNTSPKDRKLTNAIKYILKNPPKLLKCTGKDPSSFTWEDRKGFGTNHPQDIDKLNHYIRDIRNNLFHGEKIGFGIDLTRDSDLLKHVLVVLNNWLGLDDNVKGFFLGR